MKAKVLAAVLAAALLSGCFDGTESNSKSTPISYSFDNKSSSEKNDGESSDESVYENSGEETSSNEDTSSSEERNDEEIPYEERSSTGVVWDYPFGEDLSYDFTSANIIKGMEKRYGKTGEDLGYSYEWCAEIISDLLQSDGYDFEAQYNPCDLAIQLLNKDYATFYCLREENYDSLVYYGLNKTGRKNVIMTTHEDFTPKRGDFVCYLWLEEDDLYNWSHIGIVAEDYDGTVLRTIEGNIGVEDTPDSPQSREVGGREREYNETVVGFIRLK